MVAHSFKFVPPAAQAAPEAATRELGLRTLEKEIDASEDDALEALLLFEKGRLHELRDDLTSAARHHLSAANKAPEFVEALEALIDIAARSRSKANLQKLLERLIKVSSDPRIQERAGLGLALVHIATDEFLVARDVLLAALEHNPESATLWLGLETVASKLGDRALRLRATVGRAAHAHSPELRCLLLERAARLQLATGNEDDAYGSLQQSLDESPSLRALRAWQQLALLSGNDEQAKEAATEAARVLRAALTDPEVAENYDIAQVELHPDRVLAAELRSVAYALRLDRLDEASAIAMARRDMATDSPLAAALVIELLRQQGDDEALLAELTRLRDLRSWSTNDRAFLLGVMALTARRMNDKVRESHYFLEMGQALPNARLPLVFQWIESEQNGSEGSPAGIIEQIASGEGPFLEFNESRAVEALLRGDAPAARKFLDGKEADTKHPSDDLLPHCLRLSAAHADGRREQVLVESQALLERLTDERDRAQLSWEVLRLKLDREIPLVDNDEYDSWTRFVLALLRSGGAPDDEQGSIAEARAALLKDAPLTNDESIDQRAERLVTALLPLQLAQDGDVRLLSQIWEDRKNDPLVSAAFIAELERTGSPRLDAVRSEAAAAASDPYLRSKWLLRSAGSRLREGQDDLALEFLAEADGQEGALFRSLAPWFKLKSIKGDPEQRLRLMDGGGALEKERHLDHLVHRLRWSPDEEPPWDADAPSLAEQFLKALVFAQRSPAELAAVLDEHDLFDPEQRSALSLLNVDRDEPKDRLKKIRGFRQVSGTDPAWLAQWMTALQTQEGAAATEALLGLARAHDSIWLLARVDAQNLSESERRRHVEALDVCLKAQLEKRETAGDAPLSDEAQNLALAWALAENRDEKQSEHLAQEFKEFADILDPGHIDPDSRVALLLSGFEELTDGKYSEALQIFIPLREHLPDDPTLAQGIRLAAQRAARPDLEAEVSCELARQASDNHASADLWERAGVLYQEFLQKPEEAEVCFKAALSRSPGRPLAFERLYRFARKRNDRGRQVELIDARMETAETDELRVELLWEKARFCRMLGRRTIALRALQDLLQIVPDNLGALALSAELHLVDSRIGPAAEMLRRIARHSDAPVDERARAGLYASDLFEKLGRPRETVELLQDLKELGIFGSAGLLRTARSLARAEDWGEAYKAFSMLNEQQDDIASRLDSARMMLAIQRDHLKTPEDLKLAARFVLRDAPGDDDAVEVVLTQHFPQEERERLLSVARKESRKQLRETPLNPPEVIRYSLLWENADDHASERIALGNRALTGALDDDAQTRLEDLQKKCPFRPCGAWSAQEREVFAAQGQLGVAGDYVRLLSPYIALEMTPSLEAMGLRPELTVPADAEDPLREEVATWARAFGFEHFDLYVGGDDPTSILGLARGAATLVLGSEVSNPLSELHRARLVAQLAALAHGSIAVLNYAPEVVSEWMAAAENLVDGNARGTPQIEEMTRSLAKLIPQDEQERLKDLSEQLKRAGTDIRQAPRWAALGAARAAVLAHGNASILRSLSEFVPTEVAQQGVVVADILRFVLSDEFLSLRKRAGLEGA